MRNGAGKFLFLVWLLCQHVGSAQTLPVNFLIDTSRDTLRISPFIYGTNGQSQDRPANITARRIGGNRMTGYNWENNASNMGMDYNQSNANDDYLTWVAGIPTSQAFIPGITLSAFHDSSVAMACYSLITLPAAGYVSRDKNGPVSQAETAPSARFRIVTSSKGAPFTLQPDTSDGYVYADEEVNFLVSKYGNAASARGVRGYAVDNEPALWPSTHPRIHPSLTTCAEVIRKNVALAKAVKAVDPNADVFGGVFYGFNEQYNMQQAPDWSSYSSYGRYVNAFLANLRDSSNAAGKRLIDVLDLHWYPDLDTAVAMNENTDPATARLRMQVPRSLWDSSYVEPGWIGKWFSPVSLLPNMKTSINRYNPGTKIAITEFNYGGSTHISGGIAIADVLGIFGRYGVYFASHWGAVDGYVRSAYQIYRNYDGNDSAFGDISVRANWSDTTNSSVYAAVRSYDRSRLDLIVMNKNVTQSIDGSFAIAGTFRCFWALAYAFDASGTGILPKPGIDTIVSNQFNYTIPPLSVYHFVLGGTTTGMGEEQPLPATCRLEQNFPNPFNPVTVIKYTIVGIRGQGLGVSDVRLVVYDMLGREVAVLADEKKPAGVYTVNFDGTNLASGMYFYRLSVVPLARRDRVPTGGRDGQAGDFVQTKKLVLMK